MTPKEKADELMDLMLGYGDEYHHCTQYVAKQCALIAVDEILKSEPRYPSNVDWDDVGATHQYYYEAQREESKRYWQQVKQEIEKL